MVTAVAMPLFWTWRCISDARAAWIESTDSRAMAHYERLFGLSRVLGSIQATSDCSFAIRGKAPQSAAAPIPRLSNSHAMAPYTRSEWP